MKPIKEVGLELIEFENQVLLVDKKSKAGKFYYVDNSLGKRIETAETRPSGDVFEIIASTKPLEGLPLLVIEDEINQLALNETRDIDNSQFDRGVFYGFKKGYNKAKETYKFTEEDMTEFAQWCSHEDWVYLPSKKYWVNEEQEELNQKLSSNQIIEMWKSITKKELWIEVEYDHDDSVPYPKTNGSGYLPKITNNQIKLIKK